MNIQHFFDPDTYTLTYIVFDSKTKDAVIIDPVLDFDPASGKIEDRSLQTLLTFIKTNGLNVRAALETHAHADHLSGAHVLKQYFPDLKIAISEKIKIVQTTFKSLFNIDYQKTDGSPFDILIHDFDEMEFGSLKFKSLPTPGHTPACLSYLIEDVVFTGDALFMPDYGTGRCDFPEGSAKNLYHSITKVLYSLPDSTRVFVGHDYSPNNREMKFQTTIGESKKENIQLKSATSEEDYVQFRQTRDKTLKAPRLLFPSLQININAGEFPPAESHSKSFVKIPLSIKLTSGE
jgi:glyoxylase-like metal-dependent hydrolase (beta-lactamase superfamily II)